MRSSSSHTPTELMVAAAAREIRDGERVLVGMRLPLLAFLVAKALHAPRALAFYENGVIRDRPAPELLYTMGDPPNICSASTLTDMLTIMGFLQQGRVEVALLGAGEVDQYGNLNSTLIQTPEGHWLRLPGSGGACDITSLVGRCIFLLPHQRRRLPARVSYLTGPGFGETPGWREAAGLKGGGPAALITTLGIFRFPPDAKRAVLTSLHPAATLEAVQEETGWPVEVSQDLEVTPPPTEEELRVIHEYDPQGFWTRRARPS